MPTTQASPLLFLDGVLRAESCARRESLTLIYVLSVANGC